MNPLSDYLSSPSAPVRTAAAQIAGYQNDLAAGSISRAEYDELCKDAADLSKISDLAATVEDRQMIETAFKALMQIAAHFA